MRTRGRKLLLLTMGLFFGLILVETGLRVAGVFYSRRYAFDPALTLKWINILCLGESTTAGLWIPQDSYPQQLKRMLNGYYGTDRIRPVVPMHIGQNSSQIASQMKKYLTGFNPKIVVVMVGVNNEWSYADNNFVRFLDGNDWTSRKLRFNAALDRFRFYKVGRFVFHKLSNQRKILARQLFVEGAPIHDQYPPSEWKLKFSIHHSDAIAAGWEYDVRNIVRSSRKHQARVILMNYHVNPNFITFEKLNAIARQEGAFVIDNDELWNREVTSKNLTRQFVMHDNWHPNKEGYRLIAGNVFRLIQNRNLLELGPSR